MPLWGEPDSEATARLLDSPYAETYRLAREWTAGARTPYDAVRAIEGNLRRDYAYTPSVPEHTYPLSSFLFTDGAGYCQQFAGTMALMLRMVGIPSRVVSGFAPGSLDQTTGVYEVHDFDAHSWVEVYFRGIGWVTFDPTPGAAPAESQRLGGEFATAFRGPAPNPVGEQVTVDGRGGDQQAGDPAAVGEGDGGPWAAIAAGALLLLGIVAVGGADGRVAPPPPAAGRGPGRGADRRAARGRSSRSGWKLGPRTTLLAIERRSTGAARAGSARYAASLREHRYGAAPARRRGRASAAPCAGRWASGGVVGQAAGVDRRSRPVARPARERSDRLTGESPAGGFGGILETSLYHAGSAGRRGRALLRGAARPAAGLALARRDRVCGSARGAAALRPRAARRARRTDLRARLHRPRARLPAGR